MKDFLDTKKLIAYIKKLALKKRKLYFDYSKSTYIEIESNLKNPQTILENYFNEILGILYQKHRGYDKSILLNHNEFYFILKNKKDDLTTIVLTPTFAFQSFKNINNYELYYLKLLYKPTSVMKQLPYFFDSDSVTMISLSAANSLNYLSHNKKDEVNIPKNIPIGNLKKVINQEIERESIFKCKSINFGDKNEDNNIRKKESNSFTNKHSNNKYFSRNISISENSEKNSHNKSSISNRHINVQDNKINNNNLNVNYPTTIRRQSNNIFSTLTNKPIKQNKQNSSSKDLYLEKNFHTDCHKNHRKHSEKYNKHKNNLKNYCSIEQKDNILYFNTTCQHLKPNQLIKINYPKILNDLVIYDLLEYSNNVKNFVKRFCFVKNYGLFITKNTKNINFLKTFLDYYNANTSHEENLNKLNTSNNNVEYRLILFSNIKEFEIKENYYSKKICLVLKTEEGETLVFSLLNHVLEDIKNKDFNIIYIIEAKLKAYKLQRIMDNIDFQIKIINRKLFFTQIEIINCTFNNKKLLVLRFENLPLEISSRSRTTTIILKLLFKLAHYLINSTLKEIDKTYSCFCESLEMLKALRNELTSFQYLNSIIEELGSIKLKIDEILNSNNSNSYNQIRANFKHNKNKNKSYNYFSFHHHNNSNINNMKLSNNGDSKLTFYNKILYEETVKNVLNKKQLEKVFVEFFKNFEYLLYLIPKSYLEKILCNYYLSIFKIKSAAFLSLCEKKGNEHFNRRNVLDFRKKNIYEVTGVFIPIHTTLRRKSMENKRTNQDEVFIDDEEEIIEDKLKQK